MIKPLKIAYVLLYFPKLTETFVAEEIQSLLTHNVEIQIVSLLSEKLGPIQAVSRDLLKFKWNAPELLSLDIWKAQIHFLLKSGHLYLGLLSMLLKQPYPDQPFRLFLKRLVLFVKAVAVASHLENSEIDLIHAHFAWLPGAAAWICARLLDKPFTVTVHAYEIYSQKNDLLNLISREATHLIVISKYNQAQVAGLKTRPNESISVIHCGIDLAKFDASQGMHENYDDKDVLRILSIGSLLAKKGHDDLIAACHQLDERGVKFTCTIIGAGPDELSLREKLRNYHLDDRVKLLGSRTQSEIFNAYTQHDLFVLAAKIAPDGDRDGIPVVLMEAGQAGLPIISTSVSGIPELIEHNKTGWIVPPNDPKSLADAIVVLADDPDLRSRLGQNARVMVETQFDIKSSATQMAALFQRTCDEWQASSKSKLTKQL